MPSRAPATVPLLVAAWTTVVVAVVADIVAGNHPWHVIAVGAVAAALGLTRLRHAGRHRVLFGLLSALVAAQPVAHAVERLSDGAHTGYTDGASSLSSLVLTAAVITVVGTAELLGEAAGSAVEALRALLRRCRAAPAAHPELRLPAQVTTFHPRPREAGRYALRRGPPAARIA